MTARILVVDDVPANIKLLEARLLAEYFEVLTAGGGHEALRICASTQVDLVLLDIMMPGLDGFEVCRRLKADAATAHIPVVIVTALDQPADRVRGLESGADDFLTKPVHDLQLLTRVKSLVRFKALTDELRMRAGTTRSIGLEDFLTLHRNPEERAQVLLVDARAHSQEKITRALARDCDVVAMSDPQSALFEAAEKPYDLVVVSTNFPDYDPLRLCSQLRSLERTRFVPLLLVCGEDEEDLVIRALDLGVNDYLVRPIDNNELIARTRTQVRRKRSNDRLRESVQQTIELAVTDALTGLYNRRYLDTHLKGLVDRAHARGRPLSLLVTDIDHFKRVNDAHGHDVGDDVLKEFAQRLRRSVRGIDLACRFGGEEFVVAMPDTSREVAQTVAERLRRSIAGASFLAGRGGVRLNLTASMGLAALQPGESAQALFKRADNALYAAKRGGRNRIAGEAA